MDTPRASDLRGFSWPSTLFVLGGGSLELLRQLMGHSSVTTTERYAHLKPDLYRETVYATMAIDLSAPAGNLVAIAAAGK